MNIWPHRWGKRYMYGVRQTRECKRCGRVEDRLLGFPGRFRKRGEAMHYLADTCWQKRGTRGQAFNKEGE